MEKLRGELEQVAKADVKVKVVEAVKVEEVKVIKELSQKDLDEISNKIDKSVDQVYSSCVNLWLKSGVKGGLKGPAGIQGSRCGHTSHKEVKETWSHSKAYLEASISTLQTICQGLYGNKYIYQMKVTKLSKKDLDEISNKIKNDVDQVYTSCNNLLKKSGIEYLVGSVGIRGERGSCCHNEETYYYSQVYLEASITTLESLYEAIYGNRYVDQMKMEKVEQKVEVKENEEKKVVTKLSQKDLDEISNKLKDDVDQVRTSCVNLWKKSGIKEGLLGPAGIRGPRGPRSCCHRPGEVEEEEEEEEEETWSFTQAYLEASISTLQSLYEAMYGYQYDEYGRKKKSF